jgi:tetratricopeptide (TPR) repeat protein
MIEKRLLASPEDTYVRVNAGWRYFHAGQYDRAAAAAQAAAEHADSASLLGWSRLAQGDQDGAIDSFEADIERQGRGPRQIANLAAANFRAGRFDVARALLQELDEMSEASYVSPALVAAVHFAAGDADEGFRLLGEAVHQRSRDLIFLRVSWILEGYRDDPRYRQLLAQVGL